MTNSSSRQVQPIFAPVWARRNLACLIVAAALLVGAAYTAFAPAVWQAEATIIFPVRHPSALGPDMQDAGNLASALGGTSPVKIYAGILESQRTTDFIAKATGLKRKEVERMSRVLDKSAKSVITVSAKSKDPDMARRVVTLRIESLDRINQDLNMPMADNDVRLIESRIDDEQASLSELEGQLVEFQKSAVTGPSVAPSGSGAESALFASPTNWVGTLRNLELNLARVKTEIGQVHKWSDKAAVEGKDLPTPFPGSEKWRNTLSELEYDLRIKQLSYAVTSPEVKKLQKQIDITKAQMQAELEKFTEATRVGLIDPSESGSQKLPGLLTERVALEAQVRAVRRLARVAPGEAVELTRLMREIATHTVILQQLQERYEAASIQKDRDPNRWEILDQPHVSEDPINKSWFRNGAVSLLAGLFLAVMATLMLGRPKSREDHGLLADEPRKGQGRAA